MQIKKFYLSNGDKLRQTRNTKYLSTLVSVLVTIITIALMVFLFVFRDKNASHPGNSKIYNLDKVEPLTSSPLKDKHIGYLGSSVTYGSASQGLSFVEYISKRNECTYIKEAVSGTTLVNEEDEQLSKQKKTYISRLLDIDSSNNFDMFIVQLSTNDATQKRELGNVTDTDDTTICGAINYIIDYVKTTWNCPIAFFTNAYYENLEYQNMVNALNQIKDIKNISVIDLYSNEEFNNISNDERSLYMMDKIHPTKAGYLKWWTPEFEKVMYLL